MGQAGTPPSIALSSVLVATDFSTASRAALSCATLIARRFGAALYIVNVVPPDPLRTASTEHIQRELSDAWREGHRLTTDLLVSGKLHDVRHKLIVEQGEMWDTLSRIVESNSVDLIVTGTRGRSGLIKMLLGSVAELIFRQATCPVLTVGPNAADPTRPLELRRILFATDFTPQSLYAASYASSLAAQYRAHLTLLHVIPISPDNSSTEKTRMLEEARAHLASATPAAGADAPELIVGFGAPAGRILEVAREKSSDLIVLGVTHPLPSMRSAGRRWTVAAEVTAKASCPVLTVRAPSR